MSATEEISARIRDARTRSEALRIVGAGTWLDAGQQCTATTRIETTSLNSIIQYEPGDFVLTVGAGTSLHDITHATAEFGQWVTLDPLGSDRGTIGATIATSSYGPLASGYGTPRDHILGCEFVAGTGDIIRAGGQVVKNVAGFDLVRLVTGAWGTLGVLTAVTLRLRARPEFDRTLAISMSRDAASAMWRWSRDSEFRPMSAELLSPALAQRLDLGSSETALVRFGGNEKLVRAAVDSAAALGECRDAPSEVWSTLRTTMDAGMTFRISTLPSTIGPLWQRTVAATEPLTGFATATVGRGVVRCALPVLDAAARDANDTATAQLIADSTFIPERMPALLFRALNTHRATRQLEERVRRTFDPDGILNPGIFG